MKIVYCIKDLTSPGGIERVLTARTSALIKLCYDNRVRETSLAFYKSITQKIYE